jgi:hypothetical protein
MLRLRGTCVAGIAARGAALTFAGLIVAPVVLVGRTAYPQRLDDVLRREAELLAEVADRALKGRGTSDFSITWRNDFFKAQPGTFVPFTIAFDGTAIASRVAYLYVRVERTASARSGAPAYETIFPVTLRDPNPPRVNIRRGFAVPPGRYRVAVVLREAREPDGRDTAAPRKLAALVHELDVPDFWTGELATSTVILADRVEPLMDPVPASELDEDPYVVGSQRIHPADRDIFSRADELIAVFLVYNPAVAADRHFDVQVDYHLYRKVRKGMLPSAGQSRGDAAVRPGEQYVTRTNPQRFNPSLMGPRFDPAGAPVLAGQGILLADFEPGEYRLGITVTDLLSRKTLSRDVTFTVLGS